MTQLLLDRVSSPFNVKCLSVSGMGFGSRLVFLSLCSR
jgi:hypothetical protein